MILDLSNIIIESCNLRDGTNVSGIFREDIFDIDQVDLSSHAFVYRIDADPFSASVGARMDVAASFSRILRREQKMSERNDPVRRNMIKHRVLIPVPVRISIVQNPGVVRVRDIGTMSVPGHDVAAGQFDLFRFVGKNIELVAVRGMPRPGQNMSRIPPDQVRSHSTRIEDEKIRSVDVRRDQACLPTAFFRFAAPTMQEEKTFSVGSDEQMIEPMFRPPGESAVLGHDRGDRRKGDDQLRTARLQVDAADPGIFRYAEISA